MRRRTVLILIAVGLPLAVVGYSALMSLVAGALTISSDKPVYRQGEMVTFTVRNNGLSTLVFANPSLEFNIINSDTGKRVSLGWGSPQVIHHMPPLIWETIRWDQKEFTRGEKTAFDYQLVEPGNYAAHVGPADGFERVAEVKFTIS